MITSIKELHTTIQNDDSEFYNYIICRVSSGKSNRYNLYRIGDNPNEYFDDSEVMIRLGCELTLSHCREIIKKHEPNGTYVMLHKSFFIGKRWDKK